VSKVLLPGSYLGRGVGVNMNPPAETTSFGHPQLDSAGCVAIGCASRHHPTTCLSSELKGEGQPPSQGSIKENHCVGHVLARCIERR
jgi:hypothetical protein